MSSKLQPLSNASKYYFKYFFHGLEKASKSIQKHLENRTACIEMSDIKGRVGSGSKTNSVDLCYSNVSGLEILKNPKYCKGLAFSIEERQILGEIFSKLLYIAGLVESSTLEFRI